MKYKPDQIQTHEIKDATLEKGKFTKKVVHVAAGAPVKTNDTGEGYEQGSIWVDSSNGDMYICSDHSAENSTWLNMEGDDVNVPKMYGETLAWNYAGQPSNKETIERFSYSSPAAATDSGELTTGRRNCGIGQFHTDDHGFTAGGMVQGPNTVLNQIGRFPFAATYDEADVGEFSVASWFNATCSDKTYGWVAGGVIGPTSTSTNRIEKVTFGSPAPSSDIGEQTLAWQNQAGISDINNDRAFFVGGMVQDPGAGVKTDTIEYIPFTHTSGGATDWGNLTAVNRMAASSLTPTDGWVTGGITPASDGINDRIEKYSFSSPGDTSDTAELSGVTRDHAGNSSATDGFIAGGHVNPGTGTAETGDIDKFSFSAPSNSADYGELTETKHSCSPADS